MKKTKILLLLMLVSRWISAQTPDYLVKANLAIDAEQYRIDMYDGVLNHKIRLSSVKQSLDASKLYFTQVDKIQSLIKNSSLSNLEKKDQLIELRKMMAKITESNYYLYTTFSNQFKIIERIQSVNDITRIKAILKANLTTSLKLIPFYSNKVYAEDIMRYASLHQPSILLKNYQAIKHTNYRLRILDEVAKNAPLFLSYYMGNRNPIYLEIKDVNGFVYLDLMKKIFNKVGSTSKAYMLNYEILRGDLSIAEAHRITRSKKQMFNHLIRLRINKNITGAYSVDDELRYLSMLTIRRINELHEESDRRRFAIVDTSKMTAAQLYVLMVYGEDEIYTSSFLGLYKRFLNRMKEKSAFEFLHSMGMNKFRTFIKECAAYNKLESFVSKMSDWERKALFTELVDGLENENSNLELAVSIADVYGSLKKEEDKIKLKNSLNKKYQSHSWKNKEGEKLYRLLTAMFNKEDLTMDLNMSVSELNKLDMDELFKKEKNIQQHFFYDDEDGWTSYASFIYTFRRNSSKWQIIDKGNYVIIKSRVGNKVEIYANKAKKEYDGIPELETLFKKMERFPDVVVHRGHSYYADQTIESLTPSANIVILGSCGGYNNVLRVLEFSPDAAIVSSKQVGTKHVNDALIYQFNEAIRTGKGSTWDDIWKKVEAKTKSNSTAYQRFKDYIPPHKNLGAILIKLYKESL